jgi:octaprenyl-diphosphate synthase
LHDDVVDDATMRRGRPTVNHHWSNSVSVLAGNYLLSLSFSILKDSPVQCFHDAVDVISHMTQAAMAEISVRGRLDVSPKEWRDIAVGKTGALFAWCGQAAARMAQNADAANRFYECGLHIGAAFQLADDIRDLYDYEALKDRFSDIKNREPSYPILLSISSPAIHRELAQLWSQSDMNDEDVVRVGELLLEDGAGQKTCQAMKTEIDAALDALGPYRYTGGGRSIESWLTHLYEKAYDGFRA